MRKFSDFNIKPNVKTFTGDKIKIDRVLNKTITIHSFQISDSKIEGRGNGKCLTLQIEVDNEKRILFTGSVTLQDMISQVPAEQFPFSATIVKQSERLEFS